MRSSPAAQREYSPNQAQEYANHFDLEGFGYPVLSRRDGVWYIIDGQHRIGALRLMGWDDQQIECEAYEGLTEAEEAEMFLKRNHRRAVRAFDRFKVAVAAGREEPCDINRIVQALGLKVSEDVEDGCIGAVVTLSRIYGNYGARTLTKALRLARDSYAKEREAFRGEILMGIGLVCGKYDGQVDDDRFVAKLSVVPGGPLGLLGKAKAKHKMYGEPLADCVAAVIVEFVNTGLSPRSPDRLPHWWKK
jgi:hypothetical protein